jgi:hypothetical protein
MSELTITEVEVAKELPDWQGKGAKVFRYTVEGDTRRPEDFVVNGTEPKKPGDTIEGIEDGEYGPKVKKQPRRGGGGGGGEYMRRKHPEEERMIHRQHSQEMAVRICEILGHVPSEDVFEGYVNWFEQDIQKKQPKGVTIWPMTSDVPGDLSDTPFGGME